MADDISTIQIGSTLTPVDAVVTIDNTTDTVGANVSVLSGGVEVPVTVSTATIDAAGNVEIAGMTAAGTTVDLSYVDGAPTAMATTGVGGVVTTTTEAAVLVCFVQGARIRASRDGSIVDVPVESLVVGDLVVTASGEQRPIRWLGHRTIHCRRHPRPRDVTPIRIAAHAFAENRPARDLYVSPGHAICIDAIGEVLIPAGALVNGSTVAHIDVDEATYWHVELDGHDILLAENLPTESYIDCGNRSFFAEAEVTALDAAPDARPKTLVDYCRPFRDKGRLVEALRDQLRLRAEALGWRLELVDPLGGLRIDVDGCRIEVVSDGLVARAILPATAREVYICSTSAVPAEIRGEEDTRVLGLQLASLTIDDSLHFRREIACTDPRLANGFYGHENTHRWTDGRARLPAELWDGCRETFMLRLSFAERALPQWVARAAVMNADTASRKVA